jgi:tRNA nucleotidyltransferase (CCA-adding enzyme)
MSLALASTIARAVRDAGGRALIVGGWVRDRLRERPSKDIDLEVFGVPQEQLAALLQQFGRVEAVGQSFPVYKVIAQGRREGKGGRGT